MAGYKRANVEMSEIAVVNEHFCDDEPQYDEEGYCRHCGEKEDECSEYKCWIK